ncbi:MAG: CapA family protein [Patescibacteria group bacterium]
MKFGLLLLMLAGLLTGSRTEPPATLLFVGDMMLSRNIGRIMVEQNDWRYPFREIKEVLAQADLLIGNLEGPISTKGTKVGSIYSFRADPRSILGLTDAGFDVLSFANNHVWDYGRDAFCETLDILQAAKIDYVGGGIDYVAVHQPIIREVKGAKVAFLAYTDLVPRGITRAESRPAVAFLDLEQVIPDITRAEELADLTVVLLHWGNEYETKHNARQEILAHAMIEAGADLVVGHHPHVAQEVETYRDGYIAYSLGNFVFDQNFSADTRSGLMLKVSLKNKKIERVESQKIKFTPTFQPILSSNEN